MRKGVAQASVSAATFLSRDDPAAMTARGYLARTLVRRGRSGDAETIYRELLADRLGFRARTTSTPWPPGTTWPG